MGGFWGGNSWNPGSHNPGLALGGSQGDTDKGYGERQTESQEEGKFGVFLRCFWNFKVFVPIPFVGITFGAFQQQSLTKKQNRSNLVARTIRNAIRANRFARIICNWNPYFYSVSGRFVWIARITRFARITPLSARTLPCTNRDRTNRTGAALLSVHVEPAYKAWTCHGGVGRHSRALALKTENFIGACATTTKFLDD